MKVLMTYIFNINLKEFIANNKETIISIVTIKAPKFTKNKVFMKMSHGM